LQCASSVGARLRKGTTSTGSGIMKYLVCRSSRVGPAHRDLSQVCVIFLCCYVSDYDKSSYNELCNFICYNVNDYDRSSYNCDRSSYI